MLLFIYLFIPIFIYLTGETFLEKHAALYARASDVLSGLTCT